MFTRTYPRKKPIVYNDDLYKNFDSFIFDEKTQSLPLDQDPHWQNLIPYFSDPSFKWGQKVKPGVTLFDMITWRHRKINFPKIIEGLMRYNGPLDIPVNGVPFLVTLCGRDNLWQTFNKMETLPTVKDAHGNSFLMLIINRVAAKDYQHWISAGFPVNEQNKRGQTALHYILSATEEHAEALLKAGADPFIKDENGQDFFDYLDKRMALAPNKKNEWLMMYKRIKMEQETLKEHTPEVKIQKSSFRL